MFHARSLMASSPVSKDCRRHVVGPGGQPEPEARVDIRHGGQSQREALQEARAVSCQVAVLDDHPVPLLDGSL